MEPVVHVICLFAFFIDYIPRCGSVGYCIRRTFLFFVLDISTTLPFCVLDRSRTFYFMAWMYPGHFILCLRYIQDIIATYCLGYIQDIFIQFCSLWGTRTQFCSLWVPCFGIREKISCISN